MGEIFINYRRDDTAGEARALFNELREKVGADAVFMDVDNIALGRDFREVLTERLATVDVMLALIGTEWTQAKDKAGRRRLDDPNDFVRREIRAALQRNIAVTPVLLKDATMPAEADLPEDIRALAFRNAFELTHSRWSSDVSELIHRLGLIPVAASTAAPGAPRPAAAAATPLPTPLPTPIPIPIPMPMPTPTPMPMQTPATTSRSSLGLIAAIVAVLIAGAGGYRYYQGEQAKEAALKQAEADAEQARQAAEAKLVEARAQAKREADARLEQERIATQKEAAAAKQLADARLAESQRAAAARQEADAQRAADARQRAEAQRIADARQAADQAARDKATAATIAALAATKPAQASGTKLAPTASEAETQARVMADVQAGKWVGSVSIGLGDYALWKSLSWTQLDGGAAVTPCTVWARTFNNDDRARFLVSCLGASAYFNRTGMPVGRRAAQNYWNVYCGELATVTKQVGDNRDRLIAVCSRYR